MLGMCERVDHLDVWPCLDCLRAGSCAPGGARRPPGLEAGVLTLPSALRKNAPSCHQETDASLVRMLLAAGASISALNGEYKTAQQIAKENGVRTRGGQLGASAFSLEDARSFAMASVELCVCACALVQVRRVLADVWLAHNCRPCRWRRYSRAEGDRQRR